MFLNVDSVKILYVLINDCEKYIKGTRNYLKQLDNNENKIKKHQNKSKYDLKTADVSLNEENETEDLLKDEEPTIAEILNYAIRNLDISIKHYDQLFRLNLIETMQKEWPKFRKKLELQENIGLDSRSKLKLEMKGELINCSPHKDIYFLETNTKSESTKLANLFAPSNDREPFKYTTRPKLKRKFNPTLELFIQSTSGSSSTSSNHQSEKEDLHKSNDSDCQVDSNKCDVAETSGTSASETVSRKNSIDLYQEAAAILGLTCSQTDDCNCLECQCHYFDFEEDFDFTMSHEWMMTSSSSSCCIQ